MLNSGAVVPIDGLIESIKKDLMLFLRTSKNQSGGIFNIFNVDKVTDNYSQYFPEGLSIAEMHQLFLEQHEPIGVVDPEDF